MDDSPEVLFRMRCRGHENISATHDNTLEFSVDSEITGRATCVVGVESDTPTTPVAGPVRITIECAGLSARVRATANSRWRPGRNMVLRRGGDRLPNTFATEADPGSAALPRDLVAALARPDARIEVTAERDEPAAATLVLYRATEADDRLAAEVAAATSVFTKDASARDLVADATRNRPTGTRPVEHDRLRDTLAGNGRALLVATSGGFGEDVAAVAEHPDLVVEVLGLPAEQTVSAVSPRNLPVLSVGAERTRALVRRLRTSTHNALVLRCSRREFTKMRELLLRERETGTVSFAADVPWLAERPWRGPVSALPDRPPGGSAEVLLRIEPEAGADEVPEIPAVAFVRALLDSGVPPKTVSRALADTAGYSHRRAHDFVHGLLDHPPRH